MGRTECAQWLPGNLAGPRNMRVSRIFSRICPPSLEGRQVLWSRRSVGGCLAALVSDLSLLCESCAKCPSFGELRALDPLCSRLLPSLSFGSKAVGRGCLVIARHPTSRSPAGRSGTRFDAKCYWETRLGQHPGLAGVGNTRMGKHYIAWLYRVRRA